MTFGELCQRMTAQEFLEWVWLQQYEPIADHWVNAGTICATIANVNRGKNSRAMTPKDFMPGKAEPLDLDRNVDQTAAFAAFRAAF